MTPNPIKSTSGSNWATLIVALSIVLSPLQGLASNGQCGGPERLGRSNGPTSYTWHIVTDRGFKYYRDSLEATNQILQGISGQPIPAFDLTTIINGQKSVLSLGEGQSNFILELLKQNEPKVQNEAIVARPTAVDIDYVRKTSKALARVPLKFRPQYVGQYFQKLDIRTADGKRVQFDEMVSAWSLTFLVEHMVGKLNDLDGAVQMMKTILDHIKPGGVLRIWPADAKYFVPVILQLKAEGLVSESMFVDFKDPELQINQSLLAIKKSSDSQ